VPTLLIIGDSDIVRPERAVETFRLLGGVPGDIDGLPNSRLAVLPGTTHVTLGTWGALQPGDERKLDAAFIDAGDHVVAH
jgi:pimeloyl-ACP methyl ester carboxylesterase